MAAPPSTLLQPPVFYPVLPYITTVFGGLSRGRMVCIEGTVPRSCRRCWSCAAAAARVSEHSPPVLRLARVRWLLVAGNLRLYWLDSRSPKEHV